MFFSTQVTYHFFHWKKGIPFSDDQGIYNRLTWWEQIDNGKQLTRNRKFLTVVPVVIYGPLKEDMPERAVGDALEEIQSPDVSWNTILAGFAHHGLYEKACALFNEMSAKGFVPNAVTFLSMLFACGHVGKVDDSVITSNPKLVVAKDVRSRCKRVLATPLTKPIAKDVNNCCKRVLATSLSSPLQKILAGVAKDFWQWPLLSPLPKIQKPVAKDLLQR
ncbi:hypothetical protein RDABS01_025685 [Bienertia sinuspersici]